MPGRKAGRRAPGLVTSDARRRVDRYHALIAGVGPLGERAKGQSRASAIADEYGLPITHDACAMLDVSCQGNQRIIGIDAFARRLFQAMDQGRCRRARYQQAVIGKAPCQFRLIRAPAIMVGQ